MKLYQPFVPGVAAPVPYLPRGADRGGIFAADWVPVSYEGPRRPAVPYARHSTRPFPTQRTGLRPLAWRTPSYGFRGLGEAEAETGEGIFASACCPCDVAVEQVPEQLTGMMGFMGMRGYGEYMESSPTSVHDHVHAWRGRPRMEGIFAQGPALIPGGPMPDLPGAMPIRTPEWMDRPRAGLGHSGLFQLDRTPRTITRSV